MIFCRGGWYYVNWMTRATAGRLHPSAHHGQHPNKLLSASCSVHRESPQPHHLSTYALSLSPSLSTHIWPQPDIPSLVDSVIKAGYCPLAEYTASYLDLCFSFHKQPLSYFNPAGRLVPRFHLLRSLFRIQTRLDSTQLAATLTRGVPSYRLSTRVLTSRHFSDQEILAQHGCRARSARRISHHFVVFAAG